MRRIMALDYGEKTIGVAVSDALHLTAQGLTTIRRSKKEIEELAAIIKDNAVGEIVLGYPRNMNGTLGPRAEKTEQFAARLRSEFKLPVVFWDERLSTMAAERVLLQGDISRARRKQVIDKMAAVLILQSFLDRRANENRRRD
jgi:putative Holliday junction resolvase